MDPMHSNPSEIDANNDDGGDSDDRDDDADSDVNGNDGGDSDDEDDDADSDDMKSLSEALYSTKVAFWHP